MLPVRSEKFRVGTAATLYLLSLFWVEAASACPGFRMTSISRVNRADLVFRGRIESYVPLKKYERIPGYREAAVSFVVTETLRGPIAEKWTITQKQKGFGGLSDTWNYPAEVVVAAISEYSESGEKRYTFQQGSCEPLSVYSDIEDTLQQIRHALSAR